MKKLLTAILWFFSLLTFYSFTYAWISSLQITLNQWWNVVSTPAILSSITFSNGWNWISFSKLESWEWISVPATTTNIKPLEWYMVYNSNNSQVTMTFLYKTWVTPTESVLQKNLNFWWNLLWIVTTASPFYNIWWATMSVDFTNNWTINNKNIINNSYTRNTTSTNIINPEIWEAYWIFINQENAVYWWINNWWVAIPNANVNCDDAGVIMTCSLWMDNCPVECWYVIFHNNNNGIPRTILRWTHDVVILSWWYIRSKQSIQTSFNITANNLWIESMKLIVNNTEEYIWVRSEIWNKADFRFNNVSFQPNSTFYFMVDIADDYNLYWSTISFTWGDDILTEGEYSEGSWLLNDDEIMQYIEFVDLEIMPVTLSITRKFIDFNDWYATRTFYINNHIENYEVLTANYWASEIWFQSVWNTQINSIYIEWTEYNWNNIKFIISACTGVDNSYSVSCRNVWEITTIWETWKINIDPIYMRYENGNGIKSDVQLRVYVEMNAENIHTYDDLYIVINWKDHFWHDIGPASEKLKTFSVESWAHIIVTSDYTSAPRIPNNHEIIGYFNVSSSNENDNTLEFKEFILSWNINWDIISSNNISVNKWYYVWNSGDNLIFKTSEILTNAGSDINITLNNSIIWTVDIELVSVNGIEQWIIFHNEFTNN